MNGDIIAERSNRIAELMQERLGVRGDTLESKLNRAGSEIPKWVRKEAQHLVEAQRLMGHPKLMMQANVANVDSAFRACETYLTSINRAERRKTKVLGFLATNAFNLLLVGAMFVVTLRLTGQV